MAHQIFVLAALVAVASAEILPSYVNPPPTYITHEPVGPAQYSFNWNVKDDYAGNNYGHQETRDGYDTEGSYYVLLPDGRFQEVSYTVNGDSGFQANVEYQGDAHHPAPQPGPYHPGPIYH